jgi:trk system potassium uptake protein TrkH
MKSRIVLGTLGTVLKILGLIMLCPGFVAAIYHETAGVVSFALSSLLALLTGMILTRVGSEEEPGNKEAYGVVTVGWLLAAVFGALPFLFYGIGFVDALFESISGFSATGATILSERSLNGYYIVNSTLVNSSLAFHLVGNIMGGLGTNSSLGPYLSPGPETYFGLLFWRALSQLVGGMGIILLYVAILPQLGVAGRQLFKAEVVGPIKDTITPKVRETARILWKVYLLFVGSMIVLLIFAGMPVFDAICTAFAALATGGFSPRADSIAFYNSPLIDAIVAFFIFLGATSFTLHYRVLHDGSLRDWLKDSELRFFVLLLSATTLLVVIFGGIDGDLPARIRFAAFQTVSFMGTCGFVNTSTYSSWTTAAKLALIMVMLIGGCAGSTAGGIKVVRLLIDLKYAKNELFCMLHPNAITVVRVGRTAIKEDILRPILFYSFFYLVAFFALSLLLAMVSADDPRVDLLVATSGVASCMGGVGPGFGVLSFDWTAISPEGKMIGFFCMWIGRLELLPVFLLFSRELWRR